MQTLSNITLHPVLHLTTFDFDEPFWHGKPEKEGKYDYWKRILSENGYPKLEPIEKGMDYIPINTIDEPSLEGLVKWFLSDIDYSCSTSKTDEEDEAEEEEDLPTSLGGGVILTSHDQIFITPQCCTSLQDHQEWLDIAQSDTFKFIWLGHPWIYYKTEGENILFTRLIEKRWGTWRHYNTPTNSYIMDSSDKIEKAEKEITDADLKYCINYIELQQALAQLKSDLERFQNRLEQICIRLGVVNPAKIAHCLIHGNGYMFSYNKEDVV